MPDVFRYDKEEVPTSFWDGTGPHLVCWHDTEPFNGQVYSFPIRKEQFFWVVRGVFCSLSCVKRYLIDSIDLHTNAFSLFALMCFDVYNNTMEISPAPPRTCLEKFNVSGRNTISITQFRDTGHDVVEDVDEPMKP